MSANRECQAKARGQVNTQRETTGMFGELQGRSTDVADVSERAHEGYEKLPDTEGI